MIVSLFVSVTNEAFPHSRMLPRPLTCWRDTSPALMTVSLACMCVSPAVSIHKEIHHNTGQKENEKPLNLCIEILRTQSFSEFPEPGAKTRVTSPCL